MIMSNLNLSLPGSLDLGEFKRNCCMYERTRKGVHSIEAIYRRLYRVSRRSYIPGAWTSALSMSHVRCYEAPNSNISCDDVALNLPFPTLLGDTISAGPSEAER